MCVENGEASFLDHHTASICKFFVHPKHPQGTHWTSSQLYTTGLDYIVGTRMYSSSLLIRRGWHHQTISMCVPFSFLPLVCVLIISSSQHLCSWSCVPHFSFLISRLSHSVFHKACSYHP